MFLDYKISEKDYIQFLKSYFFKKDLTKKILLLIIVSGFVGCVRGNHETLILSTFIFRTIATALLLLIIFFFAPYVIALIRLKKFLNKKHLTEPQRIVLSNEGINVTAGNENTFWRWETVNKADIVDEYIFFSLFTKTIYLIPVRYFASSNEAINFLGVLKSNISKFKEQSKSRKISHLYYWGLVGFLPNFGVIAGVVLIVKGFKYNEIKLMLVGVADIVFTVLFWTTIFPYLAPK